MNKLIKTTVNQKAKLEGIIIGVLLKNSAVQFTVRDYSGRIYKLMCCRPLADIIVRYFGKRFLRLETIGVWNRTKNGWTTDPNNCWIINFSKLEDIQAIDILNDLRKSLTIKANYDEPLV